MGRTKIFSVHIDGFRGSKDYILTIDELSKCFCSMNELNPLNKDLEKRTVLELEELKEKLILEFDEGTYEESEENGMFLNVTKQIDIQHLILLANEIKYIENLLNQKKI